MWTRKVRMIGERKIAAKPFSSHDEHLRFESRCSICWLERWIARLQAIQGLILSRQLKSEGGK